MGGGGFDDHAATMGEWKPPSPSSRSLFTSMIGIDSHMRSFPDLVNENKSGPHFQGPRQEGQFDQNKHLSQASSPVNGSSDLNSLTELKTNIRSGGLMERRAARGGFIAPRLNAESIRHSDVSKEQQFRSPYLTIPPGLSPTTLLDSPVFLTNSLVQPSPTTGKFTFASGGDIRNSTMMMTDESDRCEEKCFEDNTLFAFKPIAESQSDSSLNAMNRTNTLSPFPGFGISTHQDTSFPHQTTSSQVDKTTSISSLSPENTSPPPDDEVAATAGGRSGTLAEDGYNWRKYGQKQVKGSEYPRSYYKCTHPSCPVKKKVERSHDGHVTEIIYKGAHIHPNPPPGRRPQNDGLAEPPPAPPESNPEVASFGDGPNMGAQDGGPARYEMGADGSVDGSCTFSNDEDNDNDHQASVSVGYDCEGDESEIKRRRIEAYASEVCGATRAIREPRVVVQTTSEVDILDDGYRWRKYGQKVVKGNPNPRSYYKCTSPGCNVRKHVERASHDLKSVITTYEGKHNHDVPATRNSSHANSGPRNQHNPAPPVVTGGHMQRAEPSSQMHAAMARFERPLLGPYGLPSRPQELGPGPGFGFGLSQQRLAEMGLAGLEQQQGKQPVMQGHPYFGYGPRPVIDMGFVMPKTEPKVEPVMDAGPGDSLVYQQLMSGLPLRPQM